MLHPRRLEYTVQLNTEPATGPTRLLYAHQRFEPVGDFEALLD